MAKSRKVVFDSGMLILLLQEGASAPVDPDSGDEIPRPRDRVEYLRGSLAAEKSKILIPTPALSEFLVRAGSALERYVDDITNESLFSIEPFSLRAAIEAADAVRTAKQKRKNQDPAEKAAWQRVKIDIQIAAVAKVENAVVYTTDRGLMHQAELMKVGAYHLSELPLPPDPPQKELFEDDEEQAAETEPQPPAVRGSGDGPTERPTPAEGEAQAEEGGEEKAPEEQ